VLVAWLSQPLVALLLLILGASALLLELANPGGFVAGVFGVLALSAAVSGMWLMGANMVGLVIVAAALGLMLAEIKTPGHGVLAVVGMALFVYGALVLFPAGRFTVSRGELVVLGLALAGFYGFVAGAGRLAQWRPVTTGDAVLVGHRAEVRRALDPTGRVHLHGELWEARLADDTDAPVPAGAHVRVLAREGLLLVVRPEADAGTGIDIA
jgi:membrane-bound serine protease (ClpP class)